jgi:hypothetical protein
MGDEGFLLHFASAVQVPRTTVQNTCNKCCAQLYTRPVQPATRARRRRFKLGQIPILINRLQIGGGGFHEVNQPSAQRMARALPLSAATEGKVQMKNPSPAGQNDKQHQGPREK